MKEICSLTFFVFLMQFLAGAQTADLNIADSLYAVGNYAEAIEHLESTEQPSEAVLLRLAKAQQAKGLSLKALENYREVLELNPERVLTRVDYAKLLSKTGSLREADSIFRELAGKYPENADFHFQQGLIKERQKDSTAIGYFLVTAAIDSSHQQALFRIAKHHLSKNRPGQAIDVSKQGLEANAVNASLLSILAQAYYHQKEYEAAIAEFEKLVELGHGSEFVHTKTALAYFKLQKSEKAIEHYNQALGYDDQNPATHYNLGKLYAYTGEYESSEGHLLTAILLKKQPLDAEYASLALTYKLSGNAKKALEYFNQALEENPNNERVLYERAIAADGYYKDLETRLNYYLAYLNKFEESGNRNLIFLAKRRVKDIREELHLKQ